MRNAHSLLTAEQVSVRYQGVQALSNFNLSLKPGRVLALCGPNGSGKSTALSAIRGLIARDRGQVFIQGDQLEGLPNRELAKRVALLSQHPQAPLSMTVEEVVMMGRYAYRGRFGSVTSEDRNAVQSAIKTMHLTTLSKRTLATLSGGQCQRTWIALILAQASPALLLDEPINHLDLAHSLTTLNFIRELAHNHQKAVAVVLHDLNLAARFADDLLLLKNGNIMAYGPTASVFKQDIIERVFDVECEIICVGKQRHLMCVADTTAAIA